MPKTHYQHYYGYHAANDYDTGTIFSPLGEGDIVHVPAYCPAVLDGRIPHGWSTHPELWPIPGHYRVVTVFSIATTPAWYYRLSPMHGRTTLWDECSDRLHVLPGHCDYTEGITLVRPAVHRASRVPS